MYVRREAVLSSQIEGTQSTLDDVLAFEIDSDRSKLPGDIEEVVNYVNAMNYGLARLQTLPLSLRLLREIHGRLLAGGRGSEKSPGEFRHSQNWIGGGRRLADATFIPPPPHEMNIALGNLERFLHDSGGLDPLIVCALAHAQFETIHPFLRQRPGWAAAHYVPAVPCEGAPAAGAVPQPLSQGASRHLLRPAYGDPA